MAKLLFRIGRWSFLHKWVVISIWALILSGVAAGALSLQKGFNDVFQITDVPSTHATQILLQKFPDAKNPAEQASVTVVFGAPPGHRLEEPAYMEAMDRTVAAVREEVPHLGDTLQLHNPVTMNRELQQRLVGELTKQGLPRETALQDAHNLRSYSDDGRYGALSFSFDVGLPADVTDADRQAVYRAIEHSRSAGLQVEVGGPGFGDPVEVQPVSEAAGLVVALVILAFTFGSVLAAGLPLITAVVGIGVGSLLTVGATAFGPLNSMTPTLGVMLGLAVGIDYALFIVSRYRDELRHGRNRPDAIGLATGTAGSAVVFAGLTVIIALLGLRLADITFLSYMGYAAATNVAIAVLVALTLLPAILGALGQRVFRHDANPAGYAAHAVATQQKKESIGTKWVKFIHRFPGVMIAGVMVALSLLTLPALDLQLALPSDKTANVDSTQRKSAEMLEEGFGPGRNAPFLALVNAEDVKADSPALATYRQAAPGQDEPTPPQQAAFIYAVEELQNNVDVLHAQLVGVSPDGSTAQILITPQEGPTSQRTVQLIHALRQQQSEIEAATGVDMGITGLTPMQQDVTDRLAKAMPLYLALVVGLALVLLLMVFRSVAITLMAALGFLLSVGAAFGVTVLVWQQGAWGLWPSPGPLISFMPIFLIGVTFGLAMDYQVFIVSRMRERYMHHSAAAVEKGKRSSKRRWRFTVVDDSVIGGFALGARVVTAAALIMIGVFASFVFQPLPFIQIFGFALGAGVLFDAFFIRMTFIPALMVILGRATWWIPAWLDRILPSVDVEGTALEKAFASGELGTPGRPPRRQFAPPRQPQS